MKATVSGNSKTSGQLFTSKGGKDMRAMSFFRGISGTLWFLLVALVLSACGTQQLPTIAEELGIQSISTPPFEGHCDGTPNPNVTCDPNSNLEWLDLTVTAPRSYQDISAQLGSGGDFEGYRYATWEELVELLSNAGINLSVSPDHQLRYLTNEHEAVQALQELLGVVPYGGSTGFLGESSGPFTTQPRYGEIRYYPNWYSCDPKTHVCGYSEFSSVFHGNGSFTFLGLGHFLVKRGPIYQLSITTTGTGSGTVASRPAGIDCGEACSTSFDHGASVTLMASAATGSFFTGWSGGDGTVNGDGSYTVSMTEARSVTATFIMLVGPILTVTVDGDGAVTSSPAGIECTAAGGACSASFKRNTQVTLTASPGTGWALSGWNGDASGSQNSIPIRMNADKTVAVTFAQLNGPILSIDAGGTVDRQTGVATISGTLTCLTGLHILDVTLSQQVKQGRTTVTVTGSQNLTGVSCASPWSTTVSPNTGKFAAGTATVSVIVGDASTITQTVQLR